MTRNYLKGAIGDHINLLMAAAAWNLEQWLLAILWLFSRGGNCRSIGFLDGNLNYRGMRFNRQQLSWVTFPKQLLLKEMLIN